MLGWLHKDFSLHVTMAGWVQMDFSLCRDNDSFSSACGERGVVELVTLFLTFIPSHLLKPFPTLIASGYSKTHFLVVFFSVFCQSAFAYRLVIWKYNSSRYTQSYAQTVFFLWNEITLAVGIMPIVSGSCGHCGRVNNLTHSKIPWIFPKVVF